MTNLSPAQRNEHKPWRVLATSLVLALIVIVGMPVAAPAANLGFQLYLPVPVGATIWAGGPHDDNGSGTSARNAVDLAAPNGAAMQVFAAGPGVVNLYSSNFHNCTVEIDHGNGWVTRYLHLKDVPDSLNGASIAAGKVLGNAGYPGVDTCGFGNFRHVHFSLKYNGVGVAIDGTSIGGYTVHQTPGNYCGYWTRNSDGAIVADARTQCGAVPQVVNNRVLPPTTTLTKFSGSWTLSNSNTSSTTSLVAFRLGQSGDVPLVGDWDGNGTKTPGYRRGNVFYLSNYNDGRAPQITFTFGAATDVPVVGNWDGLGGDTVGVRRGGTFYLTNYLDGRAAQIAFAFGASTDVPLVGNWDGLKGDSVGVRRGSTFYLTNYLDNRPAQITFNYGVATDQPVVGNWDRAGGDSVGLRRGNTVYLTNYNDSRGSQIVFTLGYATDRVTAGNWDGLGGDTISVAEVGVCRGRARLAPTAPAAGAPCYRAGRPRSWTDLSRRRSWTDRSRRAAGPRLSTEWTRLGCRLMSVRSHRRAIRVGAALCSGWVRRGGGRLGRGWWRVAPGWRVTARASPCAAHRVGCGRGPT